MTIDDQLDALRPLTPGVAAKLAGYSEVGSISVQRSRGKLLPADRLKAMAERLRSLAAVCEGMAG